MGRFIYKSYLENHKLIFRLIYYFHIFSHIFTFFFNHTPICTVMLYIYLNNNNSGSNSNHNNSKNNEMWYVLFINMLPFQNRKILNDFFLSTCLKFTIFKKRKRHR